MHQDPLQVFQDALDPPPRAVPEEVQTLLDEIGSGLMRWCWAGAGILLLVGCLYVPASIEWAQLTMIRGRTTLAKISTTGIDQVRFPLRRVRELQVSFVDPTGGVIKTKVTVNSEVARELLPGDNARTRVPVTYDPLEPSFLRIEGTPNPVTKLRLHILFALLLPLMGRLIAVRAARKRRLAFERGSPLAAKVKGYTHFLGMHHIDLQFRMNGESHKQLEPISPSEVDRYSPLTSVVLLTHTLDKGGYATFLVGKLDPAAQ